MFTINVIMIEEIIKKDSDQIATIDEFSMDKIEVYLGVKRLRGMITRGEI